MELNESNSNFRIIPGSVYRENRLIPVVANKKAKGAYAFLNDIRRSTVRTEELVCCLMLPDGSEGVFVDSEGREYLISKKELKEKITFVNAKFQKRVIPRYMFKRGSKAEYKSWVNKFIVRGDISKRYKGWVSANGVVGDEVLEEGYTPIKVGNCYSSDDGTFKFKILKKISRGYKIRDLLDGKVYDVALSDFNLLNPVQIEEVSEEGTQVANVKCGIKYDILSNKRKYKGVKILNIWEEDGVNKYAIGSMEGNWVLTEEDLKECEIKEVES